MVMNDQSLLLSPSSDKVCLVLIYFFIVHYGTKTAGQGEAFRSPEVSPGSGADASLWEGLASVSTLE